MKSNSMKLALFFMRISIFLVFAIWCLDKFYNPGHTSKVFQHFYFSPAFDSNVSFIIGSLQGVILVGFVLGIRKKFTYGAVLLMHLISTASSYTMYAKPWDIPNILFWAAFPMLAACYALYVLRDDDTFLTMNIS